MRFQFVLVPGALLVGAFLASSGARPVAASLPGGGSQDPVCDVGSSPLYVDCNGPVSTVPLDATGSYDPDGGTLQYNWVVTCTGGSLDDPTSPTPILSLDMMGTCDDECGQIELHLTDDNGGYAMCTLGVWIQDQTPPAITIPADVLELWAGGASAGQADPALTGMATATDNCDASPVITYTDVVDNPNNGDSIEQVITRTWTVTDCMGYTDVDVQTIVFVGPNYFNPPPGGGGQDPVCDVGSSPLYVDCNGPISTIPLDATNSYDPDGGALQFNWVLTCTGGSLDDPTSPTPILSLDMMGSCDEECGQIELHLTDDNGGYAMCTLGVWVQDQTPPAITIPADVLELWAGGASAGQADPALTGMATATDNCDASPVIAYTDVVDNPNNGDSIEQVITRTWTVTDCMGYTDMDVQTIIFVGPDYFNPPPGGGTQDPVCDAGAVHYLMDCNGPISTVMLDATASYDPDGGTLQYNWVVTCPGGSVDDPTSPTPIFSLDMMGSCDEECGMIELHLTDDNGGYAMCTTAVWVQDQSPPVITVPANVLELWAGGASAGQADPALTGMATATDNCDANPVITYSDVVDNPDNGDSIEQVITRTWMVADCMGYTDIGVQTIIFVGPNYYSNAHLDISPGSCINPIPTDQAGEIKLILLGNENFDVKLLRRASMRLVRADGVGGKVRAVRKKVFDKASPPAGDNCYTNGGDGYKDMIVIFSAEEVIQKLQLDLEADGATVVLQLQGKRKQGGMPFGTRDSIRVIQQL